MTRPLKVIEYDDVTMDFEQGKYPGVRSPSIDTLLFCRALKSLDFDNVHSVAEI